MDANASPRNANFLNGSESSGTMLFQRLNLIFLMMTTAIWSLTSGGVHLYSSFALTLCILVWWLTTRFQSREEAWNLRLPLHTTFFNVVFGFMIGVTIVSLLPLPIDLIAILSPHAAAYYRENAELLGFSATTASLSVSRANTSYGLWLLIGQCALFNASARCFYRHDTMKRLSHVLCVCAIVLVLMEVYAHLTGKSGMGMTGVTAMWHIGSMINPNHVGCVLAAISVLSLSSTILRRHGNTTLSNQIPGYCIWLGASAAMFIQNSRSALIAWLIAHIVLICLYFTRNAKPTLRKTLLAATLFLSFTGVAFWISHEAVEQTLDQIDIVRVFSDKDPDTLTYTTELPAQTTKIEKTDLYRSFITLTSDWFPAGIGRNAFSSVYPTYQPFSFTKRFMHAENEPFEVVMEYGPIAGMLILMLFAGALFSCVRTLSRFHSDRLTPAIFLAIILILMQNCFDFGLRYWPSGYLFFLLLGSLSGRCDWLRVQHTPSSTPSPKRERTYRLVGTVSLLIALVFAIPNFRLAVRGITDRDLDVLKTFHTFVEEDGKLMQIDESGKRSVSESIIYLLDAHAADALIPKLTALALIHGAPISGAKESAYRRSQAWLETALRRDPRDSDGWLRLSKLHLALNASEEAAKALMHSLTTDTQVVPIALSEIAAYPKAVLEMLEIRPQDTWFLPLMASRLLKKKRFVEALLLADKAAILSDHASARRIRFDTWLAMGFVEGASEIVESISSVPTTFSDFKIATAWAIRTKDYAKLMTILSSSEEYLSSIPEYWKLRAYYTAFHGPMDADFRMVMERLILKLNYYARKTPSWRADAALVEAQAAYRLGEKNHAANAARRVLRYRSHSKAAQHILQASQATPQMPSTTAIKKKEK